METVQDGMCYELVDDHTEFVKQLMSRNYLGLKIEEEIVKGTNYYSTFPVGLAKELMFVYKHLNLL